MGKLILLVDDSMPIRKLIALQLKSKGYEIVQAINGIEALEILASRRVDLIITDLNMPKMDGLELIGQLKKDTDLENIPVIILSSEGENRDKEVGLKVGASSYLVKPVSQEFLIDEVKKVLLT